MIDIMGLINTKFPSQKKEEKENKPFDILGLIEEKFPTTSQELQFPEGTPLERQEYIKKQLQEEEDIGQRIKEQELRQKFEPKISPIMGAEILPEEKAERQTPLPPSSTFQQYVERPIIRAGKEITKMPKKIIGGLGNILGGIPKVLPSPITLLPSPASFLKEEAQVKKGLKQIGTGALETLGGAITPIIIPLLEVQRLSVQDVLGKELKDYPTDDEKTEAIKKVASEFGTAIGTIYGTLLEFADPIIIGGALKPVRTALKGIPVVEQLVTYGEKEIPTIRKIEGLIAPYKTELLEEIKKSPGQINKIIQRIIPEEVMERIKALPIEETGMAKIPFQEVKPSLQKIAEKTFSEMSQKEQKALWFAEKESPRYKNMSFTDYVDFKNKELMEVIPAKKPIEEIFKPTKEKEDEVAKILEEERIKTLKEEGIEASKKWDKDAKEWNDINKKYDAFVSQQQKEEALYKQKGIKRAEKFEAEKLAEQKAILKKQEYEARKILEGEEILSKDERLRKLKELEDVKNEIDIIEKREARLKQQEEALGISMVERQQKPYAEAIEEGVSLKKPISMINLLQPKAIGGYKPAHKLNFEYYMEQTLMGYKYAKTKDLPPISKLQKRWVDEIADAINQGEKIPLYVRDEYNAIKKAIVNKNKIFNKLYKETLELEKTAEKVRGKSFVKMISGLQDIEYQIRSNPEKIVDKIQKTYGDISLKLQTLITGGADNEIIVKELEGILKEHAIDPDILQDIEALNRTKKIIGKQEIGERNFITEIFRRNRELNLRENILSEKVIEFDHLSNRLRDKMVSEEKLKINDLLTKAGIKTGKETQGELLKFALFGDEKSINQILTSGDANLIEAYNFVKELSQRTLKTLQAGGTKLKPREHYFPAEGIITEERRLLKEAEARGDNIFSIQDNVNKGIQSFERERVLKKSIPMDLVEGLEYMINKQYSTAFDRAFVKRVKEMLPVLESRGEKNIAEMLRSYTREKLGLEKHFMKEVFRDRETWTKIGGGLDKLVNISLLSSPVSFVRNLSNIVSKSISEIGLRWVVQAQVELMINPALKELANKYVTDRVFRNIKEQKILPTGLEILEKEAYEKSQVFIRSSQRIVSENAFAAQYLKTFAETGDKVKAINDGIKAIGKVQGVYGYGGADILQGFLGKTLGKYMQFPAHILEDEIKLIGKTVTGEQKIKHTEILAKQIGGMALVGYTLGWTWKETADFFGFGARKPIGIQPIETFIESPEGRKGEEALGGFAGMFVPGRGFAEKVTDVYTGLKEGEIRKPVGFKEKVFPFLGKTEKKTEIKSWTDLIKPTIIGSIGERSTLEGIIEGRKDKNAVIEAMKIAYAKGDDDTVSKLYWDWNDKNPKNVIKWNKKDMEEFRIKLKDLSNQEKNFINLISNAEKSKYLLDEFKTDKEVSVFLQKLMDKKILTKEQRSKIIKIYNK